MADFHWKSVFRGWVGIPILILAALAIVWLFASGPSLYENWQAKRAYEKMMEPYYNDTYGGKTPEETYDMFIDALKKGDVELASRYFEIGSQEEWVKTLAIYQKSGSIENLITELEDARGKWNRQNINEEKIVFKYDANLAKDTVVEHEGQKLKFSAGTYTNSTEFSKYPNGIWKIIKI